MARMTGSRFLAETLHGYGITHVFYMPVSMPRALREMESLGIRRVMTHGEKSAAYMADGYARVARRAGICMAQSVGAANLAAGLQDAFLACSPVLALTGRLPQIRQQRHAYQEIDHGGPFEAVTKYHAVVESVEQLPVSLRQALRETVSSTPGPAHLDVEGLFGQDVMTAEADLDLVVEQAFRSIPPFRPEAEMPLIERAVRRLAEAERPIIIAGGGVTSSDAGRELVELAEKLTIPVATSLNAKQTFPADHPLAVGVCGLYSRACANQAVCEADLVFFVGSHTGGQVTNDWSIPPAGTAVMQLDINPAELGRSYPIELGMQGDTRATLRRMVDHAQPVAQRAEWISRVGQLVRQWREDVAPLVHSDEIPIRPERMCRELTDCLPPDAILVSDTGHSGIWTGTMIDLKHPDQTYIRCSGSLGWGLPAAIGAKCAAPDRPVVCFTGDGGIWYHLSELDTAQRYGINTVTVINNNHSLNQEQSLNEMIYGGRTSGSDELWMMTDADFARVAESLGCVGIRVTQPNELSAAVDRALGCGKPAVIDVKTHIEGIAPPAWKPD